MVRLREADDDFADDEAKPILLVHDTKPPFLSGKHIFTKQLEPVMPIRVSKPTFYGFSNFFLDYQLGMYVPSFVPSKAGINAFCPHFMGYDYLEQDPTSDLAIIARKGSALVKEVREKKEQNKSRQRCDAKSYCNAKFSGYIQIGMI